MGKPHLGCDLFHTQVRAGNQADDPCQTLPDPVLPRRDPEFRHKKLPDVVAAVPGLRRQFIQRPPAIRVGIDPFPEPDRCRTGRACAFRLQKTAQQIAGKQFRLRKFLRKTALGLVPDLLKKTAQRRDLVFFQRDPAPDGEVTHRRPEKMGILFRVVVKGVRLTQKKDPVLPVGIVLKTVPDAGKGKAQ